MEYVLSKEYHVDRFSSNSKLIEHKSETKNKSLTNKQTDENYTFEERKQ